MVSPLTTLIHITGVRGYVTETGRGKARPLNVIIDESTAQLMCYEQNDGITAMGYIPLCNTVALVGKGCLSE